MDGNNEAGDRETVKKVSVLSISLSHTIQTHAALFDLQPGLFLISLRLLNLRLAAAGKDSYRLSPMRSSCVSLSPLSPLSSSLLKQNGWFLPGRGHLSNTWSV